jgi:hypothetical protein
VELGPALLPASINENGLAKARPLLASTHFEGGATEIWPGTRPRCDLGPTVIPVVFHSLFAGLVSPFSDFLFAILEHYEICLLHLHHNSILVLALFMYLCEAFLGVMPSVVLFRTFYSLRISSGNHCFGGASFHIDDEMGKFLIDMKISKKVENFRLLGLC